MSKRRTAYPPAFGEQMVELVRTGRSPKSITVHENGATPLRVWPAYTRGH